MAVDQVPAVIHGAKHSADVFRQWIHDSTSGSEGISSPTGLKVRVTPTPSNQVQVAPGGVVILNSYAGGDGQSYMGRNASTTLVDVPASDSTGSKSYNIIFRVQDPQFGGPIPADPEVGPYAFIECVSTSVTVTDPHYILSNITVPASTATIENSMLTDVREVANPLSATVNRSSPLNLADVETLTSTTTGERFPNGGGRQDIFIPQWANRVIIEAEWLQINEPAGEAYGGCWVEWGPLVSGSTTDRVHETQHFLWNTPGSTGYSRNTWKVTDDMYVPPSMRGTEQIFSMRGRLTYYENNDARPQMDQHSGIIFKATFLQVADKSTS